MNLRAGREGGKDGLTCQPSGLRQEACVPFDSSRGIILFNSFESDFLLLKGLVHFTLDNYQCVAALSPFISNLAQSFSVTHRLPV